MKATYITIVFCSLILASCSSEPSLQKYFVNHTEDANFISLDISPSILNIDNKKLSSAEIKAFSTFEKMNILAFKLEANNSAAFEQEQVNVQNILKASKYSVLMKIGSGKQGVAVSYLGTEDQVDEIIIFAKSKETGFAIIRILGDQMTSTDIMHFIQIVQKSKIDLDQLKPLKEMMPKNNVNNDPSAKLKN